MRFKPDEGDIAYRGEVRPFWLILQSLAVPCGSGTGERLRKKRIKRKKSRDGLPLTAARFNWRNIDFSGSGRMRMHNPMSSTAEFESN